MAENYPMECVDLSEVRIITQSMFKVLCNSRLGILGWEI